MAAGRSSLPRRARRHNRALKNRGRHVTLANPEDGNPGAASDADAGVKKIGFLSFGHWRDAPGSQTRTAADSLLQTIELAQAAEEIGVDGAFVRVHHFERQLASPFPLLSAIGAPQGCPNVSR